MPASDDDRKLAQLRSQYVARRSESSAALQRVTKHAPLQTRAIVTEAEALQRQLRARVDRARIAARTGATPVMQPLLGARVTRSILVVENDEYMRVSLMGLLRMSFHPVPIYGAASAPEAREQWMVHRCGVVISDMHLGPGEGGEELLRAMPDVVRCELISGTADIQLLADAAALVDAGHQRTWRTKTWPKGTEHEVLLRDVAEMLADIH